MATIVQNRELPGEVRVATVFDVGVTTVPAGVDEHEASMISTRTKAALAEAKKRGKKLGSTMDAGRRATAAANRSAKADENAAKVVGTISSLRAGGSTLQRVADQLNNMGVTTPRGKQWTPAAVRNAQARA